MSGGRLRRFAYVDDNRVLLQQTQEAHQSFRFCALQSAASSASSTSVRTPTPVALRLIRLRFLGPRRAGDVHVDPRQIAGELLEEERGGNGTPGARRCS